MEIEKEQIDPMATKLVVRTGKQKLLAEKVGASPSAISLIISGQRRAGIDLAKKIADTTKSCPLIWLYGSAEERQAVIDKLVIVYDFDFQGTENVQ